MIREYEIRERLGKEKFIRASVQESWSALVARTFDDPVEMAMRKCADEAAHVFAKHIFSQKGFTFVNSPEGRSVNVNLFAFTYDELFRLATDLYALGQKDGMNRNLTFTVEDSKK